MLRKHIKVLSSHPLCQSIFQCRSWHSSRRHPRVDERNSNLRHLNSLTTQSAKPLEANFLMGEQSALHGVDLMMCWRRQSLRGLKQRPPLQARVKLPICRLNQTVGTFTRIAWG